MSRTASMIQWVAFSALSAALALGTATPVDAQDFPLFVADRSSVDTGEAFGLGVYSVDSSGVVTVRAVVPGSLNSVREDKDGNLYTCADDTADVSRIDPTGVVSVYATGFKSCFGLLFGPDGTLYVSDLKDGRLAAVPPGGGPATTVASTLKGPMHTALDTDGSLLVTQFMGGQLSRVAADGTVSAVATGLDGPLGVAVGPDGALYVSELFADRITRINKTGAVSTVVERPGTGPTGLAFHLDGRLFVAELFTGRITAVDVATGAAVLFRNVGGAPVGLSFHTVRALPLPYRVVVDLRPGSSENPVNPRSNGVVPVAVLSSPEFDATQIDPVTIRFGVTGAETAPQKSHVEDVDGDGRLDLVFHFRTRALGIAPDLAPGSTVSLLLTGQTLDGRAIEGEVLARIPGPAK